MLIAKPRRIATVLVGLIIIISAYSIVAGTGKAGMAFAAVATTTTAAMPPARASAPGAASSPANHLCLDGDAADETYWVGYVDSINDFHHIPRAGITWFDSPQAEADYHKGYQAGWADAKVNGTTIDKDCWDTRIGN
jgi:hypothetical protein